MDNIVKKLFELRDEKFACFSARLMPEIPSAFIIGVRTPQIRAIAEWVRKNGYCEEFLSELPHKYFEENNLHAFLLEKIKDYGVCLNRVNAFLPYVDNWATCDQMRPKAFKGRDELIIPIKEWLNSDKTYTVRFAIGMLMANFSDDSFKPQYLDLVADIRSDEYYVNMMIAWYFATELAKNYSAALPYLEQNRLDKWTHNKTIQKSIESYRIPQDRKSILKRLLRK